MTVEFRLLGHIEAAVDGTPLPIGYARLRCVLAVLLVEANRPVSVDHMVDRVWGTSRLPDQPRRAVQHSMALLRRVLAGVDDVTIARKSGGYQLTVAADRIDLHRFQTLLDRARAAGRDDSTEALLAEALRLWRGEPFADLDTPWLNSLRGRLNGQRHAARLDLADVRLRLGRHATLLTDLAGQVEEHPLDERLAGQYLLCLYRCGRPAQALEHYQRLREQLVEQLGADPGPALRRLHQQILTADPAIALPRDDFPAVVAPGPTVPRQLPARPRSFVGRGAELDRLGTAVAEQAASGDGMLVGVISGGGGIGKTWLALHWAHRHSDSFPDGQLYVNLRGFDPSGQPMSPDVAIRGFLDALGVDPASVPVEPEAQIGLYRTLVAGRRVLIVLDNARDMAQVAPLLPGSPTCVVLVTSRNRLSGLATAHGALLLPLDVLPGTEALQLLTTRIGPARAAAEADVVAELAAYCGGVPLALSIIAGRALIYPDFPLSALAAELRETTRLSSVLDDGDPATGLTAVLSWSHQALEVRAARVFELLGLAPGPDVGLPAAAALAELTPSQAREALWALENASLLQQQVPGRWRLHDLVRRFAADEATKRHTESDRTAALLRLTDFYLHTAGEKGRSLPAPVAALALGRVTNRHPDEASVLEWFAAERVNLLAVQELAVAHGWHDRVVAVPGVLEPFHLRQGHSHAQLVAWRAGLAAAQQIADPATLTVAHGALGNACMRAGLHDEAIDHLSSALSLAEQSGNAVGEAVTHFVLAWAWGQHGDDRRALAHAADALRRFRALGSASLTGWALTTVAWYQSRLDECDDARVAAEEALELHRGDHDEEGEAAALDSLGHAAHRSGDLPRAVEHYRRSVMLRRARGSTYLEADTLVRLGEAYADLGEHARTMAVWHRALGLYRMQHRFGDEEVLASRMATMDGASMPNSRLSMTTDA